MNKEFMIDALPWLMSASTVYSMWLAGNRSGRAWVIALSSQCLWAVWIVLGEYWGLIPGHIALWWVYIRNLVKWRAEVGR